MDALSNLKINKHTEYEHSNEMCVLTYSNRFSKLLHFPVSPLRFGYWLSHFGAREDSEAVTENSRDSCRKCIT